MEYILQLNNKPTNTVLVKSVLGACSHLRIGDTAASILDVLLHSRRARTVWERQIDTGRPEGILNSPDLDR